MKDKEIFVSFSRVILWWRAIEKLFLTKVILFWQPKSPKIFIIVYIDRENRYTIR